VFGRKWTLSCIPNLYYPIKQPGLYRWIVFAGGFSITGILGMFLLFVTGLTIKMENIVKDRTEELLQYQDNLAELVKERTRELEITQGKLVRKERLAAVGRISGSIAHDLRNPLSAIGNAVYYLKRKVPESESKCRQYLEIIDHEVKLSGNVITNLLDLTSKGGLELEKVSLNSIIAESFANARVSDQITWRLECNPDPFMLQSDPGKLKQVLQNLLTNATQAMHGKGEITINAKRKTGKNIILFRDSGPGINTDHHKFIFEPLYSTKTKGIGLGLWICREIISLHEGSISLEDQGDKRKGACFKIELPID
jgi:signal transduction histidine kinase